MTSTLEKIRIGHSKLTDRIRIARVGKDETVALDSRDATNECIGAVIEHVLHNAPEGATLTVGRSDGASYELTVKPAAALSAATGTASREG
jgi:hypothetical protein